MADETPTRRYEVRVIFSTRDEFDDRIDGENQWVADVLGSIGVTEAYIRMASLNQIVFPKASIDWEPPV